MIAERYAKAVFSLAKEEGDYREIGRELKVLLKLLEDVKGLKRFILSPTYSFEEKRKAIEGLDRFSSLSPLTRNLFLFLVKKGRLINLPEICEFYETLQDKEEGRLRAEVSLAMEINEAALQGIKKKIEGITGKEVVMSVKIDPGLIGGAVTRIGDLVFDGSVRAQLDRIKDRLKEGVI